MKSLRPRQVRIWHGSRLLKLFLLANMKGSWILEEVMVFMAVRGSCGCRSYGARAEPAAGSFQLANWSRLVCRHVSVQFQGLISNSVLRYHFGTALTLQGKKKKRLVVRYVLYSILYLVQPELGMYASLPAAGIALQSTGKGPPTKQQINKPPSLSGTRSQTTLNPSRHNPPKNTLPMQQ